MTDLNDRLAAMLENEPPAPYDIDRVVSNGRRALRRRTTLTAVAGTAGTAAIAAAVVVPIVTANNGGASDVIKVGGQPPASAAPQCKSYLVKVGDGRQGKQRITNFIKAHHNAASITGGEVKGGAQEITICPSGAAKGPEQATPADPTAGMPKYRYSEAPQAIADRLGHHLTKQVEELGFEVVYTRPFAQESSELEKGHPSYYDGNVDVRLPDGPADIGVQVSHEVTELVPMDGECDPATCTRSTLGDGSQMQVSHIDAGSGGAEVVVVEIHRPDGVVVSAQMSNYAFGPEATRDRTKNQPLTIDQLTELAADPAWTF
jgi:hypothetical protein